MLIGKFALIAKVCWCHGLKNEESLHLGRKVLVPVAEAVKHFLKDRRGNTELSYMHDDDDRDIYLRTAE